MKIDIPDAATLRELSVKHKVDPRTIMKAIRGEPIKGAWTEQAATAAAKEWREKAKKGRAK